MAKAWRELGDQCKVVYVLLLLKSTGIEGGEVKRRVQLNLPLPHPHPCPGPPMQVITVKNYAKMTSNCSPIVPSWAKTSYK